MNNTTTSSTLCVDSRLHGLMYLTSLFSMFLWVSKELNHFLSQLHLIHLAVVRICPSMRIWIHHSAGLTMTFMSSSSRILLTCTPPHSSSRPPPSSALTWTESELLPSSHTRCCTSWRVHTLKVTCEVHKVWHGPHYVEVSLAPSHTLVVMLPIPVKASAHVPVLWRKPWEFFAAFLRRGFVDAFISETITGLQAGAAWRILTVLDPCSIIKVSIA